MYYEIYVMFGTFKILNTKYIYQKIHSPCYINVKHPRPENKKSNWQLRSNGRSRLYYQEYTTTSCTGLTAVSSPEKEEAIRRIQLQNKTRRPKMEEKQATGHTTTLLAACCWSIGLGDDQNLTISVNLDSHPCPRRSFRWDRSLGPSPTI